MESRLYIKPKLCINWKDIRCASFANVSAVLTIISAPCNRTLTLFNLNSKFLINNKSAGWRMPPTS